MAKKSTQEDQSETNQEVPDIKPVATASKKSGGKKALLVLCALLLATLLALGVYYWQSSAAKSQQAELQSQLDAANKAKKEVQDKLAKLESAAKKTTAAKTICKTLTATQTENIHAAIESKNTAALEGLMADNVEFVIAASGKGDTESKVMAIADLSYLDSATTPWNWTVLAVTLNAYKAGDYKTYVADDTIFGASANKYFVSMRVTCGQIDQIFVAANTDLL